MIGNVTVEPQAAKPAIGKIEVDLLAQPTLRANAEAVADDQHPHHQLGIDRWPPDVAIIGPQVRTNLGQVDEPVDLAQQMTVGDMPLKAKAVEQRPCITRRSPIIGRNLLHPAGRESAPGAAIKQSFSTQFVDSGRPEMEGSDRGSSY